MEALPRSRSPKGGGGRDSSTTSTSSGSFGRRYYKRPDSDNKGPGFRYGSSGNESHLPWWVWAVIALGIVFAILFLAALLVYCSRERKRKREGKSFRPGRALWKAFCIPTGVWFWIWLFRRLSNKRKSGGNYTKLDKGHPYTAWYGATAPPTQQHHQQHAQDATGHGYAQGSMGAQFEPIAVGLGISHLHPQARPVVTGPIEQTSSVPLSAVPSRNPSIISSMTAPPPYVSNGMYKPPQVPAPVSYVRP